MHVTDGAYFCQKKIFLPTCITTIQCDLGSLKDQYRFMFLAPLQEICLGFWKLGNDFKECDFILPFNLVIISSTSTMYTGTEVAHVEFQDH